MAGRRRSKSKSKSDSSSDAGPAPSEPRSSAPLPGGAETNEAVAGPSSLRSRAATALGVFALLALHYALAARSLLLENPTVDEVVHMPAGITYWQKGTFRLYHHNPPLFKLAAALPVVMAGPVVEPLYTLKSWRSKAPSAITFSQEFAALNYERYFELFERSRLVMPLFSIVGGLVVFAWARRLYGTAAGFLGLSLWALGPNVLAHARLVTSDMCATALGAAATYAFWDGGRAPTRWKALAAGAMLGIAQLSKFSMLVLYGVWPVLWLVRLVLAVPSGERRRALAPGLVRGAIIVGASVLTIDAGYLFEGVGVPLGDFEFASSTLTRPAPAGMVRPRSENPLLDVAWRFRVNRFRDTWLGRLPAPLPEHYLLGFDEQKLEAEGMPGSFTRAASNRTAARAPAALGAPEADDGAKNAYPVYLNGELRRTGWWYYYLLALVYKVPEGTWLLSILGLAALLLQRRTNAQWADEIALAIVPAVVLFSMSFLTDINLGLRYVLPIIPYVLIASCKVAPWAAGFSGGGRALAFGAIVGALALTLGASFRACPHYLAYFNWASGGPDRVPARLIDSNLDWGQDLVGLQKWWRETAPDEPIGLAYFGQINPSIFEARGEPFRWFLPPGRAGSISPMRPIGPRLIGPAPALAPGLYAVSASLVYGLPWRFYDPAPLKTVPDAWAMAWNAHEIDAFGYFRLFTPIHRIGHSILIYRLSAADVARAAPLLEGPPR